MKTSHKFQYSTALVNYHYPIITQSEYEVPRSYVIFNQSSNKDLITPTETISTPTLIKIEIFSVYLGYTKPYTFIRGDYKDSSSGRGRNPAGQ